MDLLWNIFDCNPSVKLKKWEFYPLIDIDSIQIWYKYPVPKEDIEYTWQSSVKFQNGDTIMARITPCLENGKIWQVRTSSDWCIWSTELFVFRGKEWKSINEYVYYFMKQNRVRNYAANSMTGASWRQRADLNFIKKLKFNFPNIIVQWKLSNILSKYDELIENNNRRIKILEEMAEEIYKEWFVRFRFSWQGNCGFELGYPTSFKKIKVKDITSLKSWFAFKSERFIDEWEAVAKIKDVDWEFMDTSDFSYVSEENCKKAIKFILKEWDLTVALTWATIWKIWIVPYYSWTIYTNQRLWKFFNGENPVEKLPYLFELFSSDYMKTMIVNISTSSAAQPNISPEQIENFDIITNKDLIEKYNKLMEPIFREILLLKHKILKLVEKRDLLLPRLISWKLEVK